ncbi:hypothetical protein FA95DRAFT_1491123 [Auriscalpium vulgare]|uniref:Uncharacterized protein n=1 Tax=Auriscalpium vulgare TaxID=40419 RepID=A0ACB8RVJ3_9AGAM|nr:hypothetical protein FA95DRAFT_1491123 [Auriscalpium vulgare]
MASPSYRLETPRRPPPPPIRIHNSNSKRSSLAGATPSSATETLLYDLPSATPLSPPPSKSEVASPTSPVYHPGRSRIRQPRSRATSPQPPRTRSVTPSRARTDLEEFAEHCRKWYFQQDEEAGRLMTQTLSTLPTSQRTSFVKLQASIRSAYHASVNARRTAEFRAHLSATHPGCSLMPLSRANPTGPAAQKERLERFDRFVRSWCTMGMPGTKPFFEGLWAVMRLQVVPEHLGGAGARRIEWEIDDAVFKEAAGKDFMLEAIDVLKGVLGFEEAPSKRTSTSTVGSPTYTSTSPMHARSQSQPLRSKPPVPARRQHAPADVPSQAKRPRAPSDPFLDTPGLSHSYSSSPQSAVHLSTSPSNATDGPPSPRTPSENEDLFNPRQRQPAPPPIEYSLNESEEAYLRTWTSPNLPDPEILELLKVFPAFITRRTVPRFAQSAKARGDEEMLPVEDELRFGTGKMWRSGLQRSGDRAGGWWVRFKLWWKRLFC